MLKRLESLYTQIQILYINSIYQEQRGLNSNLIYVTSGQKGYEKVLCSYQTIQESLHGHVCSQWFWLSTISSIKRNVQFLYFTFFITFKQWESHPGCTSCCWFRRQLSLVLRFRSWPPVRIIIQGSHSEEKNISFAALTHPRLPSSLFLWNHILSYNRNKNKS